MNISYLYLPHLPGQGEQCNGEHNRQPLYPRTSSTLVTEIAKNVATSIKHRVKQLLACFWLCYCFLVLNLGTSLLGSRS